MKRILAMLMVLLLVALGAAAEEAVELGGIDIDPATVEALDALEADDAIEAGDDLELVLEDDGLPGDLDLDLGLDLDLAGDGDGLALELPGGEPAFDLAASTEDAANAAVGDEIEKDGILYIITEAGATVKDITVDKASVIRVTVPASVEGYPVTAIGEDAFSECSSLTEITLPDGLTTIGNSAFWLCTSLKKLTIPATVTACGEYAFNLCASLAEFTAPACCLNGMSNCYLDKLKSVTVLDGGEYTIPDSALSFCSALTDITLPKGLTAIGKEAFRECSSLTEITLPDGLITIGAYAFDGCSSLKKLTIPATVTACDENAFLDCASLAELTVPACCMQIAGCNRDKLKSVTVLAGGEYTIPDGAFYGCSSLTDIALPKGLTAIGEHAFNECSSLTEITLPDGLTTIDANAFSDCAALKTITLPKSLKRIGIYAFSKSGLTDITLPMASEGVCSGCRDLTHVTLLPGVTEIGEDAFSGCRSLEGIEIPGTVTRIENNAFVGCGFTSITIPNNVTQLEGTFRGCNSLKSVTIPGSVESCEEAFTDCKGLEKVIVQKGVKYLDGAFQRCDSLKSVSLPDSLVSMSETFVDCTALERVSVPGKVTYMVGAFRGCTALKNITIPGKVAVDYMVAAFRDCTALESVTVAKGVKAIGSSVFAGCTALSRVKLPAGLTDIGVGAFKGCGKLAGISLPASLKRISPEAFEGCTSLKRIEIPAATKKIYRFAFLGCEKLESVTLASGVGEIGEYCFAQCAALKRAVIPASVKAIGKNAFVKAKSIVIEPKEVLDGDDFVEVVDEEGFQVMKVTLTAPVTRLPKLTIYGEAGSAAIKYAKRNKIPYVPDVSAVKLNKSKATLVVGAKLTLKAALRPTGSKSALTWSTSNKKVATVTGKGVVKAVGKGTATITVKTDNGKKATCKVTVPTPPKTVKFAKAGYTVKVGKSVKLVVKLNPTKARTTRTFTSSNRKVATVDKKGVVKGLKKGTATITVRTANGLKATVEVVVE